MRTRIISAVAVLGLGIVGIALAQRAGAEPKPQVVDAAALHDQVVKLRVEIELLQLDHDADRDNLLNWMKGQRMGMGSGGMAGMALETMLAMSGNPEATRTLEEGEKLIATAKEKGEDSEAITRRVLADAVKKQFEPMRMNYANQAAELAEKRLQLDTVEKQYFGAD